MISFFVGRGIALRGNGPASVLILSCQYRLWAWAVRRPDRLFKEGKTNLVVMYILHIKENKEMTTWLNIRYTAITFVPLSPPFVC